VRIADERYRMHLPIFPVGFLPNLRKDTSGFPLPYYSMLKAVNDFLYENNAGAKAEIAVILRTCYEPDYLLHFDQMRVTLANKEHPVSADIERLLAEAKAYEGKKDFASAIERYQQVASRAPTFALGFYKTGKFYARTGDPIRALYSYQRAYQADSTYLTAYRECYMQYLRQSNYKEMLNVLLTAVSKGNEMWEIYYNLGIAYLGDVDPAHAIPAFEHALALNGHSYRANIQLGLAYQSIKNYQKAREYFNNAIGLDPTRNEAVDYLTKLNDMQRQGK
jgi:tetratricopeptide (TPR) repeat protein